MLRPSAWKEVKIALLTGYVDESGTHDASGFIGVGGLLADADKWAHFEKDWRSILTDFSLAYSHMKEFAHSTGEFAKWKSDTKEFEPERQRFLNAILDCIIKHSVYSFGAVITKRHYDSLVPLDLREDLGTPYTFLGRYCLAQMSVWGDNNNHDGPINLAFEHGQNQTFLRFQHNLLLSNEWLKTQYRIGELSFPHKYNREHPEESVLPLQGADVIAYELVKHWRERSSGQTNARYPLLQLMDSIPHDWNKITTLEIARDVQVWTAVKEYARSHGFPVT